MNCYHVYRVNANKPPGTFELITQLYSIITHNVVNSESPLHFITDSESLKFFQQFGLDQLYASVNTDILDAYPTNISEKYWASPKVWAMKHLTAPFIVYDTDLIVHTELTLSNEVLYLHRESTAQYPVPTTIHTGPSWKWNRLMIDAFKDTLPFNCAVVGISDNTFRDKYVDAYFKWIMGSTGNVMMPEKALKFIAPSGSQIVAEQWLLAAIAHIESMPTRSLVPVIYGSSNFMSDFSMNPEIDVTALLAATIFHLWGAKQYQTQPTHKLHQTTKRNLQQGESILSTSQHQNIYDTIIEKTYAYGWK